MHFARTRAGVKDYPSRIVSGGEINKLLDRARPAFYATILLGVNCGLGPADLSRAIHEPLDRRLSATESPQLGPGQLGP
jgi:methionine synthase I (cobalamin-dependent)